MAEIIALVTNQVVLIVLISYIFLLWVALIFWTFMDIFRRSNNWMVRIGSVFLVGIGFVFGFALYLILRPGATMEELKVHDLEERLMENQAKSFICPNCHDLVREDFLFCASCGVQVKRECVACKKFLEVVWSQCPFCGVPVGQRILPTVKEIAPVVKPNGSFFTFVRRLFVAPAVVPSEIKRGRGRPRKNPEERKNEQQPQVAKRGRGRPRKTPIATA